MSRLKVYNSQTQQWEYGDICADQKIFCQDTAPSNPKENDIWIDTDDTSVDDVFEIKGNKVTSISSSSTNTQYPSAKCVYDSLALKENVSNKVTSISSSSTDIQYPSAKCVYDNIVAKDIGVTKLFSDYLNYESYVKRIGNICVASFRGALGTTLSSLTDFYQISDSSNYPSVACYGSIYSTSTGGHDGIIQIGGDGKIKILVNASTIYATIWWVV